MGGVLQSTAVDNGQARYSERIQAPSAGESDTMNVKVNPSSGSGSAYGGNVSAMYRTH
jgi:hypothetical protein